jgi:hypothetical protein
VHSSLNTMAVILVVAAVVVPMSFSVLVIL